MHRFALIDACVLATFPVADLILRLAADSTSWIPVWSDAILDEVERTHREKLDWPEHLAISFRRALEHEFAASMVLGYRHRVDALDVDPKDRHVLAAAIEGGTELVVTFNLRDFPEKVLDLWGIRAVHPQEYLQIIYAAEPRRVESCLADIMLRRKNRQTRQEYLEGLARFVPEFVESIRRGGNQPRS